MNLPKKDSFLDFKMLRDYDCDDHCFQQSAKQEQIPERIHLFTADQLQQLAQEAGAIRATVHHVLNHRIAVFRVQP